MRIKWNRHLDGSSSRRPEEGTESPEAEVKKRGPSSSPSIFRIFRRKKSRKRGEDDVKTDGGNGVVPPLEADEDDCASISSVTTCASQPSAEVFPRDRASSLFSSFRLSLPGSKRKKRRIAPTPSEALLNGQENEPQVERYSTPDLRKPTEKLEATNSNQVSLSTSSPSIRQPPKGSSTSAQSLDLQHPEVQWANSRSVTSSTSKLSKSVSFSEDGSADFSHSKCDNKTLRTVDSMAMVEEDSKPLESELSACMSDNPRKSRLNNFTSVGDSLSFSSANASNPHKQPGDEAVGTADMTKTEDTSKGSSDIIEDNNISEINNILDHLASEIRCYDKPNEDLVKLSPHRSLVISSVNCSYSNGYYKASTCDNVLSNGETDKSFESESLKKSSEKHTETGTDKLCSENVRCERSDDIVTSLCPERSNNINSENYLDKPSISEKPYFNNISPSHVSKMSLNDTNKNLIDNPNDVINSKSDDTVSSDKGGSETLTSVEKQPIITNSKHLLCHVKVYESGMPENKSENFKVLENPDTKNCYESLADNIKTQSDLSQGSFMNETKSEILDCSITAFETPSIHNGIFNFSYECNPLVNESSALNLKVENEHLYDQKVPEKEVPIHKYHIYQKDQEVPEFEQSLLEFEEVCSKYMSRSTPDFSGCSSIIPLNNSPKRKSVLDLNFSFIYPNLLEKSQVEIPSFKDEMSPRPSNFNKQNIESKSEPNLEYLCQNVTEMSAFPLPPKQWINCGKIIEKESTYGVCTNGEQCTTVRGKNLCQEPCLGALPTTVMLHDSDLEGIDTPQQSSTLEPLENKSGREHISIVATEKEQLSDDRQPSDDMISSVGITISSLNGVLDYSYAPKTSNKASVYFDTEIRETYRSPRAICDPLVYSSDATKGLESLGTENYLNGHNFCDIRNVGLCEVINDVSCDYVQSGSGLIEISNPYEEENFILPQDFSHRNLVSSSLPSDSLISSTGAIYYTSGREDIQNKPCYFNPEVTENINVSEKEISKNLSEDEKLPTINKHLQNASACKENELNESDLTSNELSKENPHHSEQKNMINKTKSSMIPCRKKGPSNIESKRIETKLKSKKNNSFPKFIKSESHLPVKSDSSHRVLSKLSKDSDVGQIRGKRTDSSSNKPNGNHSGISPVNLYEDIKVVGNSSHLNSLCENEPLSESLGDNTTEEIKISSMYSSYVLLPTDCTSSTVDDIHNAYESSSIAIDTDAVIEQKNEIDVSNMVSSVPSSDGVASIRELSTRDFVDDVAFSSDIVQNSDINFSEYSAKASEIEDITLTELCLQCNSVSKQDHTSPEKVTCDNCLNSTECFQTSRSSLPTVGMRKTSITSSKESLNSQLTNTSNKGKSRIPRKQSGPRSAQPTTKGPVRPPMWLSKAELTQEIQRLGTLCEARTKELNRLKMETKHVSVGFDAFAALFKYMVEDLNALSVPALSEDLGKTLKQLELTKQDLAYYEREVEEMKSHHCQELNDLSNKLFEVYQSEVAELNAKHQEEINHLKSDHQKQIEHLTSSFDATSAESQAHHEKVIKSLEQEIINQREELQLFQEREIKDLEEKHAESSKLLQEHIEQLQKKCAELKQHSMSMEDAMRKDTDSKLQWVTGAKLDLEKEVESLKTVLEMKNKELHMLRVQNLEMEKQLEELPLAREKIKMLQARAEDLEALMLEKTKLERKLSTENQQMRDTFEKEAKVNRRLSMENEELLWRLRQAENSLISESFSKGN